MPHLQLSALAGQDKSMTPHLLYEYFHEFISVLCKERNNGHIHNLRLCAIDCDMSASVLSPASDRRRPVSETAALLRELIFALAPEERIGLLPDLAKNLGVRIATIQQAARILEHEGLLEVRYGPGGGYYGRRPNAAALERLIAAYMRVSPATYGEALDMTSLLFTELAAAAAACQDEALYTELRALLAVIQACEGEVNVTVFETTFQDLLFRMVDRPIFEVLTRVTLSFSGSLASPIFPNSTETQKWWVESRSRIISAILKRDAPLARFEADRGNRRPVMRQVQVLREKRAIDSKCSLPADVTKIENAIQ